MTEQDGAHEGVQMTDEQLAKEPMDVLLALKRLVDSEIANRVVQARRAGESRRSKRKRLAEMRRRARFCGGQPSRKPTKAERLVALDDLYEVISERLPMRVELDWGDDRHLLFQDKEGRGWSIAACSLVRNELFDREPAPW